MPCPRLRVGGNCSTAGAGMSRKHTANLMRAAIVSIGAAVDNVHAGRLDADEREELARVCDRLAGALRAEDRPAAIDGDVISVVIEGDS